MTPLEQFIHDSFTNEPGPPHLAWEDCETIAKRVAQKIYPIVNLLDDVSASLENVLLHQGELMSKTDRHTRTGRTEAARVLCDELLRSGEDEDA